MRKTRRDFIVGGMSAGIVGDASGRPIETIFGDQIEQTHRTPFDASIRVEIAVDGNGASEYVHPFRQPAR